MQDFTNQRFDDANFSGARFRGVIFHQVAISDALLIDVDISGRVGGLRINGVDVTAYVEEELNRRHPARAKMSAPDPDSMREAWDTIERFTTETSARAAALPSGWVDESVDGEFSYAQTLRHLIYAIDRWITGPVLEAADPFHPIGYPNTPHDDYVSAFVDLSLVPSFDEILAVRRNRMDSVREVVASIDDAELDRSVVNPNGGTTTVRSCLHVVFGEEWAHDQYANRDLAVLEQRLGAAPGAGG